MSDVSNSEIFVTLFSCSRDKVALLVTILIWALFAVIVGAILLFNPQNFAIKIVLYTTALVIALINLSTLLYSARGYQVSESQIVVKRLVSDYAIERSEVIDVRLSSADDIRNLIRVFGVGGAHGYFGNFRTSAHPRLNLFASRLDHLVIIELKDGPPIMISPDKYEEFIALAENKPDLEAE